MVVVVIDEEVVFYPGIEDSENQSEKIPKVGVGTVNKSPWERSFQQGLENNTFEFEYL